MCSQTGCDAEWSFEEVCKMALLTPEEIEYFEKKMFSNSKDFFDVRSVSLFITVFISAPYLLKCCALKNLFFY